ncbi:hypothetical protein [Tahibacter soli]|uniref:Anti-sigma-K factor RskA n=1 Tax=Tahibacter soli TaxID=2983605 RepID=A0A9X4BH19_9GAMM|nr:hypothetical protein [Tahibacter soli]MDC8013575.1 hypothetical protein [Tahibacter soli]
MPTTSTADLLQRKLADPAERQRLIAAYVRETLPPDVVDAFETRLFDAPDLAADVAAEACLRDTYRSMSADEALIRPLVAQTPRRERRIGLALAAGLAAGALLPSLMWWRAEQRVSFAELGAAPRPVAESVAVFALTGARRLETQAPAQNVPLPDASRLALQVPAPNEKGPYRVRLVRDGTPQPIAEAIVANDDEGYLGFGIETAGLRGVASAKLVVDVRRGDEWVASGAYPLNFVAGAERR